MKSTILILVLTLSAPGVTNVAAAADGGCDSVCCGGNKVCKLVKTEKEVTVTCYGCKCKDICIPGPCCKGEMVTECLDCKAGHCEASGAKCKVTYSTDVPGCAKMRTIKELVKYEVKKKIPTYKWVVVDSGCCVEGKPAGAKVAEESSSPDFGLGTPRRVANAGTLPEYAPPR